MADTNELDGFYTHVQEKGKLRTPEHARRWTDGVLRTLGQHLDRRTRKQLAQAVPTELADPLTRVFWLIHFRNSNLTSSEFQRRAARRSGNTDADFAFYPVRAVFGGLREMIPPDVDRAVAESLSPELTEIWQQS
jgi:uncharacterized protein (DUF2267 family)